MNSAQRHVALAIEGASIGGGQRHVLSLAAGLLKSGWKVTGIVSGQGVFTERLIAMGVATVRVDMPKSPSLRVRSAWGRILDQIKPDILHLHGGIAGFLGRWADVRPQRNIVYTLHGIHFIHYARPWLKWGSWAMERWVQSSRDAVVCVCQSDAEKAVRWRMARPDQIHVISNGINLEAPLPAALTRRELEIPESVFLVGLAGRLTRVKGYGYALEALSRLRRRGRDVHLAFAGDGEDRVRLEAQARRLGIQEMVHHRGFLQDPLPFLQAIDVHLMPSLWEGQPLALMEAMRAGRPTIASNVDGIPEVARNGVEALLVPVGDPEAIADAVERLLLDSDLRQRLGGNARQRALLYDERNTARHVERLYEERLRGR